MIFFLLIIVVIVLYKFNLTKVAAFHEDYLGKIQTTCIKGVFAVIILFSHVRTYISLDSNIFDILYNNFMNIIGQLMVTIFLFYSGYGILEACKNNENYEKTFFRNRILKTLLHFDCAVLLYLIVNFILKVRYDYFDYIFCWIGWKAIGNSKWFIFDILSLYLLTLISFKMSNHIIKNRPNDKIKNIFILVCAGTIFLIALLYIAKRNEGSWWYDTLLSYPFGMLYSYYKNNIDRKIKRYGYIQILLLTTILFVFFYRINSFVAYNICACFFVCLITLITMKVKIVNPILQWLGEQSFSIYILQRLPMIVMSHMGINNNRYIFLGFSILSVLMIAQLFERFLIVIDKKLLMVPKNI